MYWVLEESRRGQSPSRGPWAQCPPTEGSFSGRVSSGALWTGSCHRGLETGQHGLPSARQAAASWCLQVLGPWGPTPVGTGRGRLPDSGAAAPQLPRGRPRHGAGSLWGACQARAGGFPRWRSRGAERMWAGPLPSRQLQLGESPPHVCRRSFPLLRAEWGVPLAPRGPVMPSPTPLRAGRGHQLRGLPGASAVRASPHRAQGRGVGHVTVPPAASVTPSAAGSARPLLSHPGPPPSPVPCPCWTGGWASWPSRSAVLGPGRSAQRRQTPRSVSGCGELGGLRGSSSPTASPSGAHAASSWRSVGAREALGDRRVTREAAVPLPPPRPGPAGPHPARGDRTWLPAGPGSPGETGQTPGRVGPGPPRRAAGPAAEAEGLQGRGRARGPGGTPEGRGR